MLCGFSASLASLQKSLPTPGRPTYINININETVVVLLAGHRDGKAYLKPRLSSAETVCKPSVSAPPVDSQTVA